jgi:hypothetical protein
MKNISGTFFAFKYWSAKYMRRTGKEIISIGNLTKQ